MGGDLLNQLAAIRERQGRDPIDPSRIEGVQSAIPDDPVRQRLAEAPVREDFPDDEEWELPGEEPSPLIRVAMPPPKATVELERSELWVSGTEAGFRGRPVTLNEKEKASIVTVVLKALRRSLDEQYQEIAGTRMRRTKTEVKPKRKKAASEHSQT